MYSVLHVEHNLFVLELYVLFNQIGHIAVASCSSLHCMSYSDSIEYVLDRVFTAILHWTSLRSPSRKLAS